MCLICHSISECFPFAVWIFFICFISVLIKLNLNMPSHFIFIPMMPQTQRERKGSESIQSNSYIYIVTLAFDWLKTVWMPVYQRRPCWPFSLWAICNLTSTCRVSSRSFDSLVVSPESISQGLVVLSGWSPKWMCVIDKDQCVRLMRTDKALSMPTKLRELAEFLVLVHMLVVCVETRDHSFLFLGDCNPRLFPTQISCWDN